MLEYSTSGRVHEWKGRKVGVPLRWLLSGFIEVKSVCVYVYVNMQRIIQTRTESLKAKAPSSVPLWEQKEEEAALRSNFKIASNV